MITALIFDFDGLILDTEEPIYRSWQEVFWEYNCDLTFDDWAGFIGTTEEAFNPLGILERQLGGEVPRQQIYEKQRKREMELVLKRPVLPGVLDYLESAREMELKIGLASSSKCAWVTGHLERLGLIHYFECIKGADDVEKTKPDPALFNLVREALEVPPEQVVVFEDSVNGILAAKAAGLYTVWVPNMLTGRLSTEHADMRLESLADLSLLDLLNRINSKQTE